MTDSTDNDNDNNASSGLEWGTTSFVPGSHVGLVARNTIGLIARENPSTRQQLWALVSSDATIDDILEELSATGLKSLPDFALAQVEGDNVRVVARGSASVSAESTSGSAKEIDASDVRTWVEDVVADVVSVTVTLAGGEADADVGAADGGFAVLAGSVPAASMTRRFDVADAFAADADGWVSTEVATPAAAAVADDTDQAEPQLAEAPDVELELEPVETDAAGDADPFAPADDVVSPANVDADPELQPEVEAEDEAVGPDVEPEPHSMFAAESEPPAAPSSPQPTMDPSGALLQPAEPQPAPPQPPAPIVTGAEAMGPGPADPAVVESSSDMAPIAEPDRPAPFDVQADLEQSLDDSAGFAPDDSAAFAPDDSAGFAPDGGAGVVPVAPEDSAGLAPEALPVVGVLAFSNGERINVDRSILIGRNPKVTGSVDGPLPYIMKYEGPGQGLSRTHAEVRIEDGKLVLEDLRSTNGTDVQLPGQQRHRLQGGEPIVVVPGTLIDFGEELHCTVETAL